jgi:hypothetical protein
MSESSLASVVRVQTYLKIDDDTPLARFYRKFWGKSMEDEEAEWQKGQTQIGGQPEDEDQDGYEAMVQDQDQGKRKATDKCGDDVMNEGEGEATDEDDDILPGCYDLDISIDGMAPSSLWIRADYIRIYNFFQAHYDKHAHPMARAPSAVLTGQPGIGESSRVASSA